MAETLLIGVGNRYRRDDGIGPALVEAYPERPGLVKLLHHGEGTDLMERWRGFDHVVLVDATRSGAEPGTVRVWEAAEQPLPAGLFAAGSHAIGPHEGIELARALGGLPRRLTVLGIEGADFSAGEGFSLAVDSAIDNAVEKLSLLVSCE